MLLLAFTLQAALAAPADCSADEHRQLDFWLGRWVVVDTATGEQAGESDIEAIYRGCAVQETFRGVGGFEGGSTTLWDRAAGEWVQFGTGSTGARMLFTGQWDGDRMSLITARPRLMIRMRLQPLHGGRVRQWSEMSRDHGETWQVRYDYTYAPRPGSAR